MSAPALYGRLFGGRVGVLEADSKKAVDYSDWFSHPSKRMGEFGLSVHRSGGSICFGVVRRGVAQSGQRICFGYRGP